MGRLIRRLILGVVILISSSLILGGVVILISTNLIEGGVLLILIGTAVFGIYFMFTLKNKDSTLIKIPFIISCIHLLLGLCLSLFLILFLEHPMPLLIVKIIVYYTVMAVPISICTIIISIVNYKKQLISRKKLVLIVLTNIIITNLLFFTVMIKITNKM